MAGMNVWIVLGHARWGEDGEVEAGFSTAEAAQAYYEAKRVPEDDEDQARWFVQAPKPYVVDAALSKDISTG
jgi:hypothetical protein